VVSKIDNSFTVNYSSDDLQVISKLAVGKLTIPDDVTAIGKAVFMRCGGLTGELIIPDNVLEIRGQIAVSQWGAFAYCTGFTSLHLGNGIVSISSYAFSNCTGLTGNLTFPYSLLNVGEDAFLSCINFTSLTLTNSNATIQQLYKNGSSPKINQIIFKGFDAIPTKFSNTFYNFITIGTLVTSGGSISNADALTFAKTKGLSAS
jgi:hypothetical protein